MPTTGVLRNFLSRLPLVAQKVSESRWRDGAPQSSLATYVAQGFSVVTINTGVDISNGRITKSFEVIPSMAAPPKISMIDQHVRVCALDRAQGPQPCLGLLCVAVKNLLPLLFGA